MTWMWKGWTLAVLLLALGACGKAVPINPEGDAGDAVLGEAGTRTDGSNLGAIYPVAMFHSATGSGSIPGWTFSSGGGDYPFVGTPLSIGQFITDRQTPFYFTYVYPPNNFKLSNAHLFIDTQRDSSDTEGIFLDGIFTGTPANQHTTSKVTAAYHASAGGTGENRYYNDYSIAHYAQLQLNTFDLDISKLITPSSMSVSDIVNDGQVNVVTGDDSPVYQAFLLINGYTISKTALSCANSSSKTFQNIYLHNDGNSIGSAAFSGTVETPFQSVSSVASGFKSIEFYFDPALPSVSSAALTVSTAQVTMTVRRNSDPVAVVINGIGVSEAGFDRNLASSVVEQWNDSATSYLTTFLAGIPTNQTSTAVTFDLNLLLGATKMRDLLLQGKLNLSFAGGIRYVSAAGNTSARAAGVPIAGPQLGLNGSYYVEVCTVPNNPDSPLSDDDPLPSGGLDETSPNVSSLQATEITSSSAAVQWLTDEGATSQVAFGVGNTSLLSTLDNDYATFHRVVITGLQPYKYYYYKVLTADSNGNLTTSGTKIFRTLR